MLNTLALDQHRPAGIINNLGKGNVCDYNVLLIHEILLVTIIALTL